MATPLSLVGGGGTRLYAEDHGGTPDQLTVVLLHGIGFCRLAWQRQVLSGLAQQVRLVTVDLRGHGGSDAPPDGYGDSAMWAADVRAVVDALAPARPVLVGWSYAGAVICDYLAADGDSAVRGLVLVGAVTDLGTPQAVAGLTPEFLAVSRRLLRATPAELPATVDDFVALCTANPLSAGERGQMHGWNSVVPPHVRGGMLRRSVSHDATLRAVRVPTLVVQGTADRVVTPDQARHVTDLVPDARSVTYDGVGHMPFWETQERFAADLTGFLAGLPAG